MTKQGAEALEAELKHLKKHDASADYPGHRRSTRTGRSEGKCEYHAAREQQGMVEARIRDIEGRLGNAQVIDVAALRAPARCSLAPRWKSSTLIPTNRSATRSFGDDEADIKIGKISVSSPIGRALIGKEEGDVVAVKTPAAWLNMKSSRSPTSDSAGRARAAQPPGLRGGRIAGNWRKRFGWVACDAALCACCPHWRSLAWRRC